LGEPFNHEPLDRDVNGNGFFDPADGDIFSEHDLNNNGRWDPGEPLAIDVNGNGFFDPGDVFDTNDLDGNGVWSPTGEVFTDQGNGVRDPSEPFDDFVGFDGIPDNGDFGEGNGQYDGPEPLVCDVNGNGLLDPGDVFDPATGTLLLVDPDPSDNCFAGNSFDVDFPPGIVGLFPCL